MTVMPLTLLATNGCENGPCPTFYKAKGGVVVRGYQTSDPEHTPPGMPEHEGVLFIPDADWDHLLSELPWRR
jgi:hypothetical protein